MKEYYNKLKKKMMKVERAETKEQYQENRDQERPWKGL